MAVGITIDFGLMSSIINAHVQGKDGMLGVGGDRDSYTGIDRASKQAIPKDRSRLSIAFVYRSCKKVQKRAFFSRNLCIKSNIKTEQKEKEVRDVLPSRTFNNTMKVNEGKTRHPHALY